MYEKNFEKKFLVPWDPLGVPRVPISGPNRGIFSKLIGPGPLGSGGHSHTSFSNGRFRALETSFHIDVLWYIIEIVLTSQLSWPKPLLSEVGAHHKIRKSTSEVDYSRVPITMQGM